MTALVFGLGHPDGGDDAVGLLVAEHLARQRLPGMVVRALAGPPLQLLSLWTPDDDVVVVDAARGGVVGSVRRYDDPRRLPGGHGAGSHDASLVMAIELAAALDRLPRTLVVYGIAGRRFGLGDDPEPAVLAAVAPTAARIAADATARC